jgi:hypothetical protein
MQRPENERVARARRRSGHRAGSRCIPLPLRCARPLLLVLLVGAAGLAGLAASSVAQQFKMPRVDVDFDKEVDFSGFKSFSWKDTEPAAQDPQMHTRIVWYVERELEKKGLKKAEGGKGDVLVRYYAKKHEGLKGTPSQSQTTLPGGAGQLTTSVDFRKVLEGTLLVELQRTSDEKAVWRAAVEYHSIDKQRIDAETASAVRLLIGKYPPPVPQP